jgi:ADP-ribose pyrophosphatase YjhB (NUDIX family)
MLENIEYIYLEHDGKILLVDGKGNGPQLPKQGRILVSEDYLLRLPTYDEVLKLKIPYKKIRNNVIIIGMKSYKITIGEPKISWPEHWAWKDNAISDNVVHPIVRECIYRTIHRIVSKVIILNDENKILMAKSSRGFFTGYWTLPGGFVNYGEHPREGAEREVLEELGIIINISDPMGESGNIKTGNDNSLIQQEIFNEDGINWVSFTYRSNSNVMIENINPKEGEIEEVRWFDIEEALKIAVSHFDINAIKRISN